MKELLLKNWGNIFGLLGLVATIYVGVFYVPIHVRESLSEKQKIINIDLVQATKELIYNDSICTIKEIQTLIDGKEAKYGIQCPYSIKDLLLQTQDAFMEHKFLPLSERKKLIQEIEELKIGIKLDSNDKPKEHELAKSYFSLLPVLSILGTVIAVILGIYSFVFNARQEKAKTEEINNQIEREKNERIIKDKTSVKDYENSIIGVIKNKFGIDEGLNKVLSDSIIDYKFIHKGKKYYVIVKYLSECKIGLGAIERLFVDLKGKQGNAIVVYNTELTTLVINKIEKFKKQYPRLNVKFIKALNAEDFEINFDELVLNSD